MRRIRNTDCIGEADFNRARLGNCHSHGDYPVLGNLTLERAAKAGGDGGLAGFAGSPRGRDNRARGFDRAFAGLALIGHGKSIGRYRHRAQLIDPAGG